MGQIFRIGALAPGKGVPIERDLWPSQFPAWVWLLRIYGLLKELEARAGIEPAHKGFADLSLTTWVPRLGRAA